MTNLQAPAGEEPALAGSRLSPRQLLLLPLALGGVVALALLGGWVIPQLQKLNETNQRQAQKQATAAGIPLLRQQLDQTITATQRAEVQQARLLALIAGSGDLATFLTQVDRQAQRHGVQTRSYIQVSRSYQARRHCQGNPQHSNRPSGNPGGQLRKHLEH